VNASYGTAFQSCGMSWKAMNSKCLEQKFQMFIRTPGHDPVRGGAHRRRQIHGLAEQDHHRDDYIIPVGRSMVESEPFRSGNN